ncbi:MAG: TlpA family protein disulfide reductase [Deltaproteobacteria bacterium]|nr:TlpA family protein disulfide reductase [Deltaproteobacteria bacterium]
MKLTLGRGWLGGVWLVALLVMAGPVWAATEGGMVPDFSRPNLDGAPLSLQKFRGRVVILDFFATWCGPCTRAMPRLDDLQRTYGKRGLSVIGYSVDEGGRQAVRPYVARLKLSFPVVLGDMDEAKEKYGVEGLPTTLVIDPQGRLVKSFLGLVPEERILAAAEPFLNDRAPSPPLGGEVITVQQGPHHRLKRNWVTFDKLYQGQRGIMVHVAADVADLNPLKGLWLALNLAPARLGPDRKPQILGKTKRLYQRIDDVSRDYFILFVACPQLPDLPPDGAYLTWVSLLGPSGKDDEEGDKFWLAQACHEAPPPRAAQPTPPQPVAQAPRKFWDTPDVEGRDLVPPVQRPALPLAVPDQQQGENGRIKRAWLAPEKEHAGKKGLLLQVDLNLHGLSAREGMWLCVNVLPQDSQGRGLTEGGRPLRLHRQIQDVNREHYVLFIPCDQLGTVPAGGQYRMWLTLEGGNARQVLDRSSEQPLDSPCQMVQN